MITIDSPKLQADIKAWSDTLRARFELLKQRSRKTVLVRQAGLLCRTLINVSPPVNKKKTADRITDRVNKKFHQMGSDGGHMWSTPNEKKQGKGDVKWYAFSKYAIYGVAKDVDFTDATPEQLYSLYFGRNLTSKGRFKAGMRGKQRVMIWQKITTDRKTVKKLIKRLLNHIGRLKAGWAVSWKDAGSPGSQIPNWIGKHVVPGKARGYSIRHLDGDSASFTIVNTAKGVSAQAVEEKARAALRIRLKAMTEDVRFALKHPDQWSEREAKAEAAIENI